LRFEFGGETDEPEIEAILVNRINITELQATGDSEKDAATKILKFLSGVVANYGRSTLVGYNSNTFDLAFLRNILIRYGINPYFEGKLANLDILHFAQYLAFSNVQEFPWTLGSSPTLSAYYDFKLETLAKAWDVLTEKQTHQAYDDVVLTINLTKKMSDKFNFTLKKFNPIQIPQQFREQRFVLGKEKIRDFSGKADPKKFIYKYWLCLQSNLKSTLLLDLSKYIALKDENPTVSDKDILECLKYVNPNKQFKILELLNKDELKEWEGIFKELARNDFLHTLTMDKYFQLIKKDWDIEYQIYDMGFQRITVLNDFIKRLNRNFEDYMDLLNVLLSQRSDPKDNYLIQLLIELTK